MTALSPRLVNILTILLRSAEPVSVDRLADMIGVSRRTIFRDLEGADAVLRETGMTLSTIPGKGIQLSGDEAQRERLQQRLTADKVVPRSRNERQTLLSFLLIDNDELQKLYYYAKALSVSEATVSLDMDFLEPKLRTYELTLDRRKGQGALLTGAEENIRRAMVDLIMEPDDPESFAQRFGFPSVEVVFGIRSLLREQWMANLDWMTTESLTMLEFQLVIMVDRVRKHHTLTRQTDMVAGLPQKLANQICDSIEKRFSIQLPAIERTTVGLLIRTCRAKQLNPFDINDDSAYSYVQSLAFRMIDAFDPALSGTLKINEDLVSGLSVHLWSAVARLKQGVCLHSEMQEQIRSGFPEVYEKSRVAAGVLEKELGISVPDSEVAFIASHFGAALLHLGERSQRNVILKAGIVCVAGIGISYMMSSQVRQRFQGKLEVVVSEWNNPEEWANYDLLISSIPLDYDRCPVIVVSPILTEEDDQRIRRAIRTLAARHTDEIQRTEGDLPDRMDRVSRRLRMVSQMLRDFSRVSIHADCAFDDLAKMIGYRFGTLPESGHQIYDDLLRREAIATQVVPQLSILLLHTRTTGIDRPVVSLISPEGGQFKSPYFQGARGGLLLLAPQRCDRDELKVFGYISSALVEDDVFLGAVQTGNESVAYRRVEAAMMKYLKDDCSRHLDIFN